MAQVTVNGDTVEVLFTFPTDQAQEMKDDFIEMFAMTPQSTATDIANEIARRLREMIRSHRKRRNADTAAAADPGTVDFT